MIPVFLGWVVTGKELPMRARDLMTAPVITVQPWTSAKEAAGLLSRHGFTALPVVDDDDRPLRPPAAGKKRP